MSAAETGPEMPTTSQDLPAPDEKCAICLGKLGENGQSCELVTCAHTFCEDCIHQWLTVTPSCPLCKTPCQEIRNSDGTSTSVGDIVSRAQMKRLEEASNRTELTDERRVIRAHLRHLRRYLNSMESHATTTVQVVTRTRAETRGLIQRYECLLADTDSGAIGRGSLIGLSEFRRLIYAYRLRRENISISPRHVNFTRQMAHDNTRDIQTRLRPWLTRELAMLLKKEKSTADSAINSRCVNILLDLLLDHQINSPQFSSHVARLIGRSYTDTFCGELYDFACSGLTAEEHDVNSRYSFPDQPAGQQQGGAARARDNEVITVEDGDEDDDEERGEDGDDDDDDDVLPIESDSDLRRLNGHRAAEHRLNGNTSSDDDVAIYMHPACRLSTSQHQSVLNHPLLHPSHIQRDSPRQYGLRDILSSWLPPGFMAAPSSALASSSRTAPFFDSALLQAAGLSRRQAPAARWQPPQQSRVEGIRPQQEINLVELSSDDDDDEAGDQQGSSSQGAGGSRSPRGVGPMVVADDSSSSEVLAAVEWNVRYAGSRFVTSDLKDSMRQHFATLRSRLDDLEKLWNDGNATAVAQEGDGDVERDPAMKRETEEGEKDEEEETGEPTTSSSNSRKRRHTAPSPRATRASARRIEDDESSPVRKRAGAHR